MHQYTADLAHQAAGLGYDAHVVTTTAVPRDRYAADSRLFGGFLLAFAGWPLLAAAGIIVVMGLLVTGLFVAVFFPKLFASKPSAA